MLDCAWLNNQWNQQDTLIYFQPNPNNQHKVVEEASWKLFYQHFFLQILLAQFFFDSVNQKVIANWVRGLIKVTSWTKGSRRGSFLMSKHHSLSAWSVQRRSTWTNRNQANVAPAPATHSERSNATNAKVLAPIRNALRPNRLYWSNRSSISERNTHRSSNKGSNGGAKQNRHDYSWSKERQAAIAQLRRTERKLHAVADWSA